jgi:archaemetzincin
MRVGTVVLAVSNLLLLGGAAAHVSSRTVPECALVWVVPGGTVARSHVLALVESLRTRTTARVVLAPRVDLPASAYRPKEERYEAQALMDDAVAEAPADAWRVVLVTDVPLLSDDGDGSPQAVMGTGLPGGRAAVISTYTLGLRSRTSASLQRRAADLMLHELGHTLGLHHCRVGGCVMSRSRGDSVVWADMGRHDFCPLCRMRLPEGVLPPLPDVRSPMAVALQRP